MILQSEKILEQDKKDFENFLINNGFNKINNDNKIMYSKNIGQHNAIYIKIFNSGVIPNDNYFIEIYAITRGESKLVELYIKKQEVADAKATINKLTAKGV